MLAFFEVKKKQWKKLMKQFRIMQKGDSKIKFFQDKQLFKMAYIPNDLLAEARKMDLLTYLMNYQHERLKKILQDTYSIKNHDSLHISNGL